MDKVNQTAEVKKAKPLEEIERIETAAYDSLISANKVMQEAVEKVTHILVAEALHISETYGDIKHFFELVENEVRLKDFIYREHIMKKAISGANEIFEEAISQQVINKLEIIRG